MTTWVEQLHAKASIVHDQIVVAREMQRLSGIDTSRLSESYLALLEKLYTEDFPLARLLDNSDIMLHAEGPATSDASPTIHAVNWLCQTAEKQIRNLAKATFDLSSDSVDKLANQLDLRLTGFAPGSIYVGLRLQPPSSTPLIDGEVDPIFTIVKNAITQLSEIPNFVGDESINTSINEALPDAAIRDAMLTAALHLAPTGKLGIHTLELSSPQTRQPSTELSQRERVVIREALKRPILTSPIQGTFIGQIREFDLDARRFHLRNVKECGTLRCIVPPEYSSRESDFKNVFGEFVSVTGGYETDRNGKPRLLIVSALEKLPQHRQLRIQNFEPVR
jgi:hypothetical protein